MTSYDTISGRYFKVKRNHNTGNIVHMLSVSGNLECGLFIVDNTFWFQRLDPFDYWDNQELDNHYRKNYELLTHFDGHEYWIFNQTCVDREILVSAVFLHHKKLLTVTNLSD